MRVYCHLTREQATLYQAVVDEMLREGRSRRRASSARASSSRR